MIRFSKNIKKAVYKYVKRKCMFNATYPSLMETILSQIIILL